MSGIPAGFEDDDDDFYSNFDYDEKDHENYMREGIIEDTVGSEKKTEKNSASVFNQFREVPKDLTDQLSLDSDKIRVAIVKGNLEYLTKALKEGYKPDQLLRSGWPALLYASSYGMYDAIKLLLEYKASVNLKADTVSPLMVICQSTSKGEDNLVKCAELLIEAGGDVNDHDKHIMTPVMYAAQRGLSKFVKLLCEKGAAIDMQDSRGWTALSFAAVNGYNHVVKVLLENNADHHLTTLEGQSPADQAFSNGYSMLSELLEKYDGKSVDSIANLPDECSTLKTDKSSKYVSYGDLELFLFGLELGHLVPVFQDQHLTFPQMLKLDESELSEAGVTKLGDRKKLHNALQNVRTSEWDTSTLTKESMAKLGIIEMATIIANITKHVNCIQSCAQFVKRSMDKPGKTKELAQANSNLQKTLSEQSKEALRVTKAFALDIATIHKQLSQVLPKTFPPEADFIGDINLDDIINRNNRTPPTRKALYRITAVTVLGLSAFCAYRWIQDR